MRRYPDWQSRLERFLTAHAATKFQYGTWDCCLFVADAIAIMTGQDLAESFRKTYRSRKEALVSHGRVRKIAEHAFHGLEPVPVLKAQRGDVVLVKRSRDYSLGLISLNGRHILAVSKQGFLCLPLDLAVTAWHV